MQQEVITGAAVKILLNGKAVAIATSISVSRNQNVRPIYGIDNVLPQEIAITGPYAVTGQLNGLRIRSGEGIEGAGIIQAATIYQFFYQKLSTLEVMDIATNKVIAKITGVVFGQDSFQVANKSLMTFSANFTGVFMSVEHNSQVNSF